MATDAAAGAALPTLSNLIGQWIERHCVVGDSDRQGQPYRLTEEMWAFLDAHYGVRPSATPERPASAWLYRRSQLIRPQKWGKGPFSAAIICVEAVGPAVFDGFARRGDAYRCSDHGCPCGWKYAYEAGEPMARPWTTPLIQITAASEDQTDNVWRQLVPMIELGPLGDVITDTGETRINLPGGGRIDPVTSKARSRLGQPVTFVLQDETGTWTKSNGGQNLADTQRRGLAGMGGRAIETTNAWDPAENSVAQQGFEANVTDVYRDWRRSPGTLSYGDKRERRRIHKIVYGDSWWVDVDRIEADALEILERDPGQAERFFGNRAVAGRGSWLADGLWAKSRATHVVPAGAAVALGFDGSESGDWTAIRLVELGTRFRFTPRYGPDRRSTYWDPAEWGGAIPRGEVRAAVDEVCRTYKVVRAYCDPRDWQSEIGDWSLVHGDDVFLEWATYRISHMHGALTRSLNDLRSGRSTHDDCKQTELHVANSRKIAKPGDRYILGKPNEHQKIDLAMADTLAHEAAEDALAAGWSPEGGAYAYFA